MTKTTHILLLVLAALSLSAWIAADEKVYEAPRDIRKVTDAKFTSPPTVKADGKKATVSFTVSRPIDVEIAVLDSKDTVIRHLAAGLLGKNAPSPLQKNSLEQSLSWDRKDDAGKQAEGGPFKVRLRLGVKPKLNRILGWDGNTLGSSPVGMAVGKGGELYVLESDMTWGRAGLRVFGPDGKYRRTIMPYPANTPKERTAQMGHLEVNGERLPIVFNGNGPTLVPLTDGMKHQTMAWHPKGYLLVCSAVGTINAHGLPRHLLAFHPEGGMPADTDFVGPEIRKPRGFMGGVGEAWARFFDHLAVSTDGEYIYFTPCKLGDKKPRHAVFRMKWSDKEMGIAFVGKDREAGADDAHLNDPQGIACDTKGNLYVCDRGNDRVMVFTANGKLLGKFPVEKAEQIAVHPGNGEIYILSRARNPKRKDRWDSKTTLRRFSAWGNTPPRELAKLTGKNITLIALDPESVPARVWCVFALGWGKLPQICPVTAKDGELAIGKSITNSKGLGFPMFIAADPGRGRVIVRERAGKNVSGMRIVDMATDRISPLPIKGVDVAVDHDGNLYAMDGYGTNSLSRYTPDGKPLPFAATGSHKLKIGTYRAYGPNVGLRGLCVGRNGDIYVLRTNNSGYGGVYGNNGIAGGVDIWSADGKIKKQGVINGLGWGDSGLAVDAAGNIYVGINLKKKPLPSDFEGKAPAKGWLWWRKDKRKAPWYYAYHYAYLFHLGSLFKFGPEGGTIYGNGGGQRKTKDKKLPALSPLVSVKNAPAEAEIFRSGYMVKETRVVGAKWYYPGCSVVSASDVNWGDPSCCCITNHLAADPYGRVYMPNAFLFTVEMIDSAGNQLVRIGTYGNADSAGPKSKVPDPGIAFANPIHISYTRDKVYVSDPVNRRITVVDLMHSAEVIRPVP